MFAKGEKVLFRQNFETVTTAYDAGWTSPNHVIGTSIISSDEGRWFEFNLGKANDRNAVFNWNHEDGTIFDDLDVKEYTVKFKWGYIKNSNDDNNADLRYNTEIALLSGNWNRDLSGHYVNNDQYVSKESLRLFCITQLKGVYSDDNPFWTDENDNINYINDFYIDGDKENRITLIEGDWYDITVNVNVEARTTTWSIYTKDGKFVKQGNGTIPADCNPYATGINVLLGRYNSIAAIDDVKVLEPMPIDYANVPSVWLSGIDMAKRSYQIFFEEGETLHLKGPDGAEKTSAKNPFIYTTETSGILEAWTEYGSCLSEPAILEVDASTITLPEAVVNITKVKAGFEKTYQFTVDNDNVPTQPTISLTYKYNGKGDDSNKLPSGTSIDVFEKGVLEVTTHADGFESSTVTIDNDVEYILDKVIDFQHMDEAELIELGFEEKEPLQSSNMMGENNWTSRGRLWYGIADGGTDEDGKPTYETHVVYGSNELYSGAEPIRRFYFKPSKLTEDVAKTIFAPVKTWFTGGEWNSTQADGNDVPGIKFHYGLGMIQAGILGDDGFEYNPSVNKISYQNAVVSVSGLTDEDYYIVYLISDYGRSSLHPLFPKGTTVADATAQYKTLNLGDGMNPLNLTPTETDVRVLRGTETFNLYRIDTAISRIEVFKKKGGNSSISDTFTAKTVEGVEMTFKVISATDKTCQVGDGKNLAIDKDYSGALTIPSEINGFSVTAIAGRALYGCSLISVSIPNSVKSIGERAFQLCTSLSSINFPNSLTSIGECAFNSCHQLNSITIPKSVTNIGYAAFSNIFDLKSLVVENGNTEYDSRGNCNAIICIRNNELIAGCQNTIIPSSVTSIGRQAFLACSGLTSLTIPNSVTSIGYNAFHGCTSLTEITIPASITDITNGAFGNCINIGTIVVESGNKVYDSRENCNAVIKTETNELIIGCYNSIIPNSVSKIGEEAFYYCSMLSSINIPNSIEVIGRSAFYACGNLNAISLPGSLTIIENQAFEYCSSLTSVTVDINKPLEINENVFSNQSDAVLYVPKGCIEAYRTAESWKKFGRIIEIGGSDETVLFDGDTFTAKTAEGVEMTFKVISATDKICQVGDDNNPAIDTSYKGTLTIPATANDYRVTTIGSWALFGCYGITDLIISEGIESLMDNSIEWCDNVTSIVLPASINYLSQTFGGFSRTLKFISVASGNKVYDSRENCNAIIETATNILRCGCVNTVIPTSVTEIGAWSMCNKLESITIPEHITAIGEGALRYNRYEEITIPASVKTIGVMAFESCWNLKKVNILSEKCDIGFDAFAKCAMLKTVNSYQKSPSAIPDNAFSNSLDNDNLPVLNDDLTLYVPFGTKSLYETTDGWKNFKVIKEFVEEDGVAFAVEDDKTVSLKENNGPSEKEVEIPASVIIEGESYPVTTIGENAFENNETLELMTIPETINEICDGAFAGCSGLKAIYCYAEDPIALGSESAKVRTRADGEDISASTVFAEVDKESCILYVPKNCGYKYRAAGGWSEFRNIVEILSDEAGDANNDGKVDDRDIETITKYVLNGDTNDFIFKNANVNGDKTINVSDIVIIVNMIK